ncbi:SpaA isopeptide-forming pilin-related protein [Clostridium baratii]|uniref:SpaA isopeptide-forming pilin-related protein n=1 Tax=Clostridium baratii TaxID=1561 RepID=UPI0030D1F591
MLKKIKKNFKKIVSFIMLGAVGMSIVPVEAVQDLTLNSNKEKIIKQYINGVKMLPEQIAARKEKAEELNLLDYVDDRYFLTDEFYEGKSEAYINEIGANILVDTVTEDELEAWSNNLKDGVSPYTVTKYDMVSFGGSTVGKYEVDGKMAFCAQHSATSPAKGSPTSNARLNNKDTVRKVLYYGYGGPGQLKDMKGNYGWVMTSLGLSYAYTGNGGPGAKAFVNRVSKLATPPSSFKVYVVDTNGGRTQDLAYWNYSPKGELQIEKSSADTTITNGNNCYSLAGAVYGVYKNSNATNKVAELKTGSDGKSNTISLDEGTYYIKEITPPKGFALDNKIYSIKVNAGKKAIGKYKDRPQADPIGILIKKVDAQTGESKPQGKASLEGAEFTIKYYSGDYAKGVNPETLGKKPTRTWVLKTDNEGFTYLDKEYKVRGDEFYYNSTSDPTIPAGTVTAQETKAPEGYKINPEIFIRKITTEGIAENINTYNVPIVKEEVIKGRVKVTKVDEETGKPLKGAEFELKEKATGKVVEKLITGEDGTATSGLHPFAEYILKETKAPDKFVLNGKEHFVTISEDLVTVEVTHQNKIIKGRIEINKEDSEIAGLKLEGVKFGIFDENNKLVEELTTDANGHAISDWLNYGDYILKELSTKDNYILSDKEWKVEIRADQKTYTYDIKNGVIKGKIQVVKVDAENAEKPVEGAVFGVYAKNVFGVEAGSKVDEITTDANGFAYTKDLRAGDYYLKELSVGDDYWLNEKEYPVTISKNEKIEVVHIKNEPVKMKLRVVKKDSESKEAIKGTKFKVVNKETGEDVEFTDFFGIIPVKKTVFSTDKNGEILFPQALAAGEYTLVEVNPSEGFNSIEPIDFTVDRNTKFDEIELLGKVTTIEVENTRIKGNLKLVKVDEETKEKEPLEGVKFKITCTDGFMKGKEWTEVTDENGEINLTDLEFGKYEAEEVEGLWNYVVNKEPIKFEVTENGKTIELNVTNKKIRGSVELVKVDEDTRRPLEGAEFELWNGEKLIGTYTTDKDGKIVVENLEAGQYYFKEIKAPDNYNVNDDVELSFEILEDKEIVKLEVSNKVKEGEVDFAKTDLTSGELVEGATIHIKGLDDQNKHINFEFVSGKDEKRFKLPVGKYEFSEVKAPEGYVINSEPGYFEILENEVIKAELKNKRIEGTLDFTKVDVTTGKPLDGAQIKIECLEGFDKGKVIEFTSSKDGNKFKLFAGKYKISETQAPEGYETTTETGTFEITEEGQVIKCKLENKMKIKLPATGYKANIALATVGAIIVIAGVFLVIKRRKK